MKRQVLYLSVVLSFLISPVVASADEPSRFGRLFPNLPAFTDPTNQQLADLAQTQLDPNADADNNCADPFAIVGCTFAGFTYFGQFIDHDLTLDTSPTPTGPVDPTTLTNNRTFRFDLDSVYAGGPSVSPQLYEADRLHFKVQDPNVNGVRDLPRNPDGSAILVERRNDENQILSQIHVAFLKFHNRLIDENRSFADAQRILQHHYQWAVVNDYFPHVLDGDNALDDIIAGRITIPLDRLRLLLNPNMTPVEFSVAAFRFGHTQVRRAYRLNNLNGSPNFQVFSFADPLASLMGGRPLAADRQIKWGAFFEELPDPTGGQRNIGRKIDPLISQSLFQLPIPGAEAEGSNVLAFRNMLRAKLYGLPSGQDVARALGMPVISPAALNLGPGFERGTPLWYYVLAESSRLENGQRIGPVGSRIVAETFYSVLKRDPNSYLNTGVLGLIGRFRPDPRIAGADGRMTISDIFQFARVAA